MLLLFNLVVLLKTDPAEHSDWRWAQLHEVKSLYITPAMEKIVRGAFAFAASCV